MGAELQKGNGTSNNGLERKSNPENGNPASGRDTRNTPPADTRAGTADARAVAGGNPAPAGNPEKEKFSGLASVSDGTSAPIPETPKKKQPRKKKTTTKKKQEQTPAFDSKQITALLVSVSAVIASRPNMQMFALSEMEAEQIATPLSNIFAKSEKLSKVNEHADAIALVSACLIIMLPRIIMYFDVLKQNKIKANGGVKLVDRTENKKAESTGNNRRTSGNTPANNTHDVNGVLASIPSIV